MAKYGTTLASNISSVRGTKLTSGDMSRVLRVSPAELTAIEAGTKTPPDHQVHEAAKFLAVSVEQLKGID